MVSLFVRDPNLALEHARIYSPRVAMNVNSFEVLTLEGATYVLPPIGASQLSSAKRAPLLDLSR